MENCKVGMFNLPGIKIPKNLLPPDLLEEMQAWSKECNSGSCMNEDGSLWSFRNEKQREWFVLRWSDLIPKPKADEEN